MPLQDSPDTATTVRPAWAVAATVVGASLAVWLASSDWPGQIDDVFITIAYAWRWVDGQGLTWDTGERIEAYSNPLLVALLALGALARQDLGLLAKVIAAISGVAVLGFAAGWSPRDVRAVAVTIAIAVWAPFAYWSSQGMETMLFAALGSLGWAVACRRRTDVAVPVLALAALTRPEGHAWLLAALVVRVAAGTTVQRRDAPAVIALTALSIYHVVRVAWFGAPLPGPYHVKIADTPLLLGLTHSLGDLWRDLALTGGIAIAVICAVRPARRDALVVVPLVVQVLVLARLGGDWMGHARLLVPGVLATALSALATAEQRPYDRRLIPVLIAVVPFGLLRNGVFDLQWRPLPPIASVVSQYQRGIDTPLSQDVQFVVEHVPAGGTVLINDVGMPGNVPDVEIIDYRGLANARIAALPIDVRGDDADRVERIVELLGEPPQFVRLARWQGEPLPMIERTVGTIYTEHTVLDVPYSNGRGRLAWWWRPGLSAPDDAVVLARWRTLVERFPSQPFLYRQYATALLRVGDTTSAANVLNAVRVRWPDFAWADVDALWFPDAPFDEIADRGVPMYWNQVLTSRPFPAADLSSIRLQLGVDGAGADGARVRVEVSTACGRHDVEVTLREAKAVDLPTVACEGSARVVVEFLNDTTEPEDRNVYARLRRR